MKRFTAVLFIALSACAEPCVTDADCAAGEMCRVDDDGSSCAPRASRTSMALVASRASVGVVTEPVALSSSGGPFVLKSVITRRQR